MSEDSKKYIIKEELGFDIITSCAKIIFSKRDIKDIKLIEIPIDNAIEQLGIGLIKQQLAKWEEFKVTYVPKTWKDHFKKKNRYKWWMRWWVKRKPIQHLSIKKITIFPDVKVPPTEDFKTTITFLGAIEE